MNKELTFAVLATILVASVTLAISPVMEVDAAPKKKACNNVKVQIRVDGVEENQTLVATAQIGESAKTKAGTVEENETSITIPLNFKRINPCPEIGSPIFGNVNGTGFEGELKSLKKPNRISVDF